MLTRTRKSATSFRAVGALMVSVVTLLSCSDEPTPIQPEPKYQVGALEGFVLAAGEPAEARVRVRAQERFDTNAETRTDSTGWYRVELPVGRYVVVAEPSVGWSFGSSETSIVQVEPRVMRHDIRMGRVNVRILTPEFLEERQLTVNLQCLTRECRQFVRNGAVESEGLEIDFPLVDPGRYRMQLDLEDVGRFWFPGTPNEAEAEFFEISADVPATYELSLKGMASIRGSVTGSWQQLSFRPPTILALSTDSTQVAGTSADTNGDYRLNLLSAQPVKLVVEVRGVEQWIGGADFRSATVYVPEAGDLIEAMPIVEAGVLCRLTGIDPRTSYRTSFLILDAFGNTYRSERQTSNPAAISNLAPGRYFLYVHGLCSGETWASQWYDAASSVAAATPIELAPGEVASITVSLWEGASVSGRISSANGEPVRASIEVRNEHGDALCSRTSFDGVFTFTGMGDGDYYLTSRFLNFTWWYPGTTNFDLAEPIHVRDGMDVTAIEWRFPF